MKNKFLFTVILTSLCILLFIVKTFAQEEHNIQSFKVNKGGSLKVEISGGDILIKTGNDNEVKVSTMEDEDYKDVSVSQDGNNITVESSGYIDFVITVPPEYNLNLNTSGGDIELVNNIRGKVKINTSGGDILLKDVVGEVNGSTAGGDIKCGNVKGNVRLNSSGGDISVSSAEGECMLSTGGGDVIAKDVTKSLTVSTGGGNVDCSNIDSDLKISTGGGNVSMNNISGVIKVTTGGGDISGTGIGKGGEVITGAGNVNLKNLSGYIIINSGAGDISAEFVSVGNKESKIVSGYGNITIYIPENSKVTIEAKVKFSEGNVYSVDKQEISESIKSEFKSSTEDKRKGEYHAVYIVNGGGTNIELETSIGNIEIKKLKR